MFRRLAFIVAILASLSLFSVAQTRARLSEKDFTRWLKEEVTWIISQQERSEARGIKNDGQRADFVENFWLLRDPTPNTPANEYRDTHYARLEYANNEFREGGAGWRTDRGRVYILHGPPVSRNRRRTQEVWVYNANPYGKYYTGPLLLVFAQGASSFQATQLSDTLTARNRNAPSAGPAGVDIPSDLGVSSSYRLIVAGPVNELTASATETVLGSGPASERLLTGTIESERYIADVLRSPGDRVDEQRNERQRRLEALDHAREQLLNNPGQSGDLSLVLVTKIFRQGQATGLHFSVSISPDQLHRSGSGTPGKKEKKKRPRKASQAVGVPTALLCEVIAGEEVQPTDSLDGTMNAQPGQELVFSGWFELDEGDSRIQCLAHESDRNRFGWASADVRIPPVAGAGVGLSGLLLTSDAVRMAPDHPPMPLVFENIQFRVPPLPKFLAGPLFLYFQVFNGIDNQGRPKKLHYDYFVQTEGKTVLSSLPLMPFEEGEPEGPDLAFARTLDFSNLKPGEYTLKLRLLEAESRRPVTGKVDFEILSTQDRK